MAGKFAMQPFRRFSADSGSFLQGSVSPKVISRLVPPDPHDMPATGGIDAFDPRLTGRAASGLFARLSALVAAHKLSILLLGVRVAVAVVDPRLECRVSMLQQPRDPMSHEHGARATRIQAISVPIY